MRFLRPDAELPDAPVELPLRPDDPLATPLRLVARLTVTALVLADGRAARLLRLESGPGEARTGWLLRDPLRPAGPLGADPAVAAALLPAGTSWRALRDEELRELEAARALDAADAHPEPPEQIEELRERLTPEGLLRRLSVDHVPAYRVEERVFQMVAGEAVPFGGDDLPVETAERMPFVSAADW